MLLKVMLCRRAVSTFASTSRYTCPFSEQQNWTALKRDEGLASILHWGAHSMAATKYMRQSHTMLKPSRFWRVHCPHGNPVDPPHSPVCRSSCGLTPPMATSPKLALRIQRPFWSRWAALEGGNHPNWPLSNTCVHLRIMDRRGWQ